MPPGAPQVKLMPGGQMFSVEGAEPILEAALRAGLAVAYGCASGNCGACKARVVAGGIRPLRTHDFRLTDAEKLQGYALMCCSTALTDLIIEAPVAQGAAEIPHQSIVAHVRRMERLSDEVMLLELVTPRTNRLRFLAGQSAVVGLGGLSATLPIASCPCEERRLHFHLRRAAGDSLSDYAFGGLRIGEPVSVEGPVGDFMLREGSARPLAFIAWGWEGFAPVKSVIEHALQQEAAESIDLYWIGAAAADHYYPKLCRSWAEALDHFRYALVLAGPELHGDAARDALAQALPDPGQVASRDYYIAGNFAQVAASRKYLGALGLPAEQLVAWVPR
jgi:CDP-4-dehydro-6-deoxyglucose reductase, E3